MKRNNELVYLILKDLEGVEKIDFSKYDDEILNYHKELIINAKLADGRITYDHTKNSKPHVILHNLTNQGHDYLENPIKAESFNIRPSIQANDFLIKEKNILQNQKSVFLSYCHANTDKADKIDENLKRANILVIRDIRDLHFTESVSTFEEGIRDHNKAIMLISDEFLKSEACMNEVVNLLKERKYRDKILPIVEDLIDISSTNTKFHYVDYWNLEFDRLNQRLRGMDPIDVIKFTEELKKIENIKNNIGVFIDTIKDMLYKKYNAAIDNKFVDIIKIIQSL